MQNPFNYKTNELALSLFRQVTKPDAKPNANQRPSPQSIATSEQWVQFNTHTWTACEPCCQAKIGVFWHNFAFFLFEIRPRKKAGKSLLEVSLRADYLSKALTLTCVDFLFKGFRNNSKTRTCDMTYCWFLLNCLHSFLANRLGEFCFSS